MLHLILRHCMVLLVVVNVVRDVLVKALFLVYYLLTQPEKRM